jgi:signal transduction histidine kinase
MSFALPVAAQREAGFGPQWWRSGTRTWRWWSYGAIAYALVSADAVFQLRSGAGSKQVALNLAGCVAEITVGLLFWMWRRNLIGPLILTYVVVSLPADLSTFFSHSRLAWTLYYPFNFVWQALLVWMLLAFPSGRLWNRASAWLVVYMAAFFSLVPLVQEFFRGEPRTYLYLGHGWSGLRFYTWFYGIDVLLIWAPFVAFAIARIMRTAPGARRRFLPLYASMGYQVFFLLPTFAWYFLTAKTFAGEWPTNFPRFWTDYAGQEGTTLLFSAAGAAIGLALVRQKRSSVADLVVELGQVEPGKVRDTLATALGDPNLVLGLWLPERGVWVDEDGHDVTVSEDDGRAVTYVGDHLAVMQHHPDLLDQPRLLEAVGSAGRLALENERLQVELRAQLAELRESRARIVRAGDEERRRLERDLHDGAQQRLLAVGMALQLLGSNLNGNGTARELLGETEAELQDALRELRELARGIHPAVLTDQGLDAAVRTLAERAPIPVTVETTGERLPAYVETAAYFVVAEALTNVAKYAQARHAWVELERRNGEVRVEVRDDGIGGAAPSGTSGLTGLADRVGALGGRLSIDSPPGGGTRIEAVIPCGS